jgi:hypothetical protein
VYGDDIICGLADYEALLQYYPTVGLMFNHGKCCVAGRFRESCGLDVYDGVDVTPIKVRRPISPTKADRSHVASYCAYQRAFWKLKCYRTAEYIQDMVEKVFPLPRLDREHDVPFLYTLGSLPRTDHLTSRFNVKTQRISVRCVQFQNRNSSG